jgi:hypothetical protein
MYWTADGRARLAMSRLGRLFTQTLAGGLVGAIGGAACGVLFGAVCWAAFGQVSLVWASGAVFLRACAAAGVVASLSTQWIDPEPLGWRDLLPRRAPEAVRPAKAPGVYAFLSGEDFVLRTTGQAMRVSGDLPAESMNGVVNAGPSQTRLP